MSEKVVELITQETLDSVTIISIRHGKVNAFTPQLISQLHHALDCAQQQENVVVLTGQAGILSAGFDLNIMQHSAQAQQELIELGIVLMIRLLSFPTPIVVAANGHAVALGAFLLLAGDMRIGAQGDFKIGFNEVAIGMEMPQFGVDIARARLPRDYLNRSVLLAELFSPDTAIAAGFLDMTVPADQLLERAISTAKSLSGLDMDAHHRSKLRLRAQLLDDLQRGLSATE